MGGLPIPLSPWEWEDNGCETIFDEILVYLAATSDAIFFFVEIVGSKAGVLQAQFRPHLVLQRRSFAWL